eukprot:TRINITY_DN57493_c0_g1_i1.p1 TRINITY_DN57493_c0_g1~~TRINITY_DN57493_c0_g1_i1.p1  ORF type:complete len:138 (-),score=33.61 TRINITY_DN57493_c0_g1_i1:390-803(-)
MTDDGYKDMRKLSKAKNLVGLHILAFPCNQFGQQEPGTPKEIQKFVSGYGISINKDDSRFHLMEKIDVNGPMTHPVYSFLKKHTSKRDIEWNFDTTYVIECEEAKCKISRHEALPSAALKMARPKKFRKRKAGDSEL